MHPSLRMKVRKGNKIEEEEVKKYIHLLPLCL